MHRRLGGADSSCADVRQSCRVIVCGWRTPRWQGTGRGRIINGRKGGGREVVVGGARLGERGATQIETLEVFWEIPLAYLIST